MYSIYPAPWRGIEGQLEKFPKKTKSQTPRRSFQASVLVVDDEPRARASLKEVLRYAGYEITLAEGGREAIELLGQHRFDLLLLDLNMPDLDGHGVMRYLNEHKIDCDIIVVSGESTFDSASRALRRGARDFLRKPYAPDELLRTIANTVERRRLRAENRSILKRLEESEQLHKFIVNNSPDMVYLLDHEGRFAFVNDRIETLLGYKQEDILGEHFSKLIFEHDIDQATYAFNERRTGDRATRSTELRLRCKDGDSPRYFESRAVPIELSSIGIYSVDDDNNKAFVGTYGVARDITERKQAEELIKYQLYHDLLTNLPNRSLFRDRLNMAMAQSKRSGKSWRSSTSTWTASRPSTTRSAISSATSCCRRWPSGCAANCARPIPWPGSAVTSSISWYRRSTISRTCTIWPKRSCASPPGLFSSNRKRSTSASASAFRSIRRTATPRTP
jgi:PAS domain S-box-containing protein